MNSPLNFTVEYEDLRTSSTMESHLGGNPFSITADLNSKYLDRLSINSCSRYFGIGLLVTADLDCYLLVSVHKKEPILIH